MESSTMKEAYSEIQRLSDDVETRKAAIANFSRERFIVYLQHLQVFIKT